MRVRDVAAERQICRIARRASCSKMFKVCALEARTKDDGSSGELQVCDDTSARVKNNTGRWERYTRACVLCVTGKFTCTYFHFCQRQRAGVREEVRGKMGRNNSAFRSWQGPRDFAGLNAL